MISPTGVRLWAEPQHGAKIMEQNRFMSATYFELFDRSGNSFILCCVQDEVNKTYQLFLSMIYILKEGCNRLQ